MIKKLLLLLFLIVICIFFLIFYLVDRVYINSYIKNLEKNFNINISLQEPHQLKVVPNLSLLVNFNLENKERNILIEDGELSIKKYYNFTNPKLNFSSKRIIIDKLIFDNLITSGEINEYNLSNLLKLTLFPEGYFSFKINDDDEKSLQFINIIAQRLNIPKAYKQFIDVSSNFLKDKSLYSSKIIIDKERITVDYFESLKNEYSISLTGELGLENEMTNLEAIIKMENEKIFEIKILGNVDNPKIYILSNDKILDVQFNLNDFNQILDSNFDNILNFNSK
ncbi:hypothetical protein OAO21_04625 [Alphaproteobacteria bacterium]|nr:hypothetical protein [Alphaproteobacteria bacterium]